MKASFDVQGPFPGVHLGNAQYTVGLYPWATDSLYARDINAVSGSLISPTSWYLVNGANVNYHWDLNKNMAVTNCSNSGDDIMTAWYNGTDVVYKYSQPNTMSFRPAKGASGLKTAGLSANVAGDNLLLSRYAVGSKYQVLDMAGRLIRRGAIPAEGVMHLQDLPSGNYVISVIEAGKPSQTAAFTKQ